MFVFCNKGQERPEDIDGGTTVLESAVPFPFSIGSYNLTDYLAHLFLNCNRIKNGDRDAWRAMLPGKCKLDDAVELRKKIAKAKPLEGRTEPYVLRGRNN